MKRLLHFGLSLLLLFCGHTRLYASHCAGGELLYEWKSDSTYRMVFKLYRDCAGNSAPSNVDLCYRSTCNPSILKTTLLPLSRLPDGSPNGSPVSTGCGGFPSKCASSSSTLPGYAEWWYAADITLPYRCSEWQFSVSIDARNSSINLSGGSNNFFYIHATLNNQLAQGNSSPFFSVKPVPFVCINNPYTFNNGASDVNGDSLAYEIMMPQKGNCGSGGVPIDFISTSYNLVNNPILSNNSFVMDPITGQLSFTPAQLGANTLTLRVKEYRNGILVGSTMRDIQVQVLSCNSVQPRVNIDSISISGARMVNGRIENCANTQLNFCFGVKSPNAGAVIVVSDNHGAVAAGAVMSYTGQRTDSVTGCFSWTPTAADTGLTLLAITVKDSTCLPPGIAVSQTFVLPVYVYAVTHIQRDTSICAGDSVTLVATGGGQFTWSVLPGGASISSLSCTNCSSPRARPSTTTSYVVVSDLQSACSKNRDTVLVQVSTTPPPPQISSNGPVCAGDTLKLAASSSGAGSFTWTGPAGFRSDLQNPEVRNIQTPNSGTYTAVARNNQCISAAVTMDVLIIPGPSRPRISGDTVLCTGQTLRLITAGSDSAYYRWTGPDGYASSTKDATVDSVTVAHSGVYVVSSYYITGGKTCESRSASQQVTVLPDRLFADFRFARDPVCQYDTVSVAYTGADAGSAQLNWWFGGGAPGTDSGAGPFRIQFTEYGNRPVMLAASNGVCRDTIRKSIRVLEAPVAQFSVPEDACIGQQIQVQAAGREHTQLQYNWDFGHAEVSGGPGRGPYTIHYDSAGYKQVTLRTHDGSCASLAVSDTVYVHPTPDAVINTSSTLVCRGDSILLSARLYPGYRYSWKPEQDFSDSRSAETIVRILRDGAVQLEVADALGCTGTGSLYFTTRPCCEVWMPNAFTPNGDGRNDVFRMVTAGNQRIADFRVINRWGQAIFATADPHRGWDGTWNGTPADPGTYHYYLRYVCTNGMEYELKGDVQLLR